MIMEIIEKNRFSSEYIYLSLYNLGKEEILLKLAQHFNTKIIVS